VSYRQMRRGSPVLYKNVTRVGTELYGLEHNTVYLIGVIAGTAGGLGEAGPEVKVQTLTNERLEPVNVSAVFLNSSVIEVKWAAPSHVGPMFIRGFRIYYREEGNERTEQRFVSGGHNNQFLLTGVTHTVVYFLKVTTLTTWGYEASSPWTRLAARAYESHPSKPEDVKAEANHDGITLSWRRPRNSNSLEVW
ncbi:netrin receptor dcc, partial [Plakobranchus ocellatus]